MIFRYVTFTISAKKILSIEIISATLDKLKYEEQLFETKKNLRGGKPFLEVRKSKKGRERRRE